MGGEKVHKREGKGNSCTVLVHGIRSVSGHQWGG